MGFLFFLLTMLFGSLHAGDYIDRFYLQDDPPIKTSSRVDLVAFSYDRPIQLYALLESCEKYFVGINSVHVILRYSNDEFAAAYKIVKERFPYVIFHKQLVTSDKNNFKKLVLEAVYGKNSKARFIMFAVDDLIVTDFTNLSKCVEVMRRKRPWCFSLRLGQNIHLDTIRNIPSPPPRSKKIGKNMMCWEFSKGAGGWNYPNSVDLTIYKKTSIRYFLKKGRYSNPNTLEGAWSLREPKSKRGCAFRHSKAVNIPLNVVNPLWTSQNMEVSTEELLKEFQRGKKINIEDFHDLRPYATHMPLAVTFTTRDDPEVEPYVGLTKSYYFIRHSR